MKNFIEFRFDEEGNFYARIHINGQRKIVKKPENLKEFLLACKVLGYHIHEESIITDDVEEILRIYKRNLKINTTLEILGEISEKMKLSTKDPTIRKRLVAGSLAGLVAAGFLGATTRHNNEKTSDTSVDSGYHAVYNEPERPELPIYFGEENDVSYTDTQSDESTETTVEIQEESQVEEDSQITEEISVPETKNELASMLDVDNFHYSHSDRSDDKCIKDAHRYDEYFEKYAKRYGLDKNLLAAIAAHECYGDHERGINVGPAEGLMQIEKSVHLGYTESAYNFETGEMDKVTVTIEKLQDVETNIQIAAMILQNCMELWDYNIPLAVQTYNLGIGNINKMLSMCSELEGIDKEDLKYNQENNAWLNYRAFLKTGDPNYVENVFCFLPNHQQITVQKRSGETSSVILENDYELTHQKTN